MAADSDKDNRPGAIDAVASVRASQRLMLKPLRKRFYKTVTLAAVDGGFALLLDRTRAKTPGGRPLVLASRAAGELIAAEWAAQGEHISPAAMPATRIVHSALDGVALEMAAVRAEIVKFAGSDLVCYRAGEPAALDALQAQAWDPVIGFARDVLKARLVLAQGITYAAQPDHALDAIRDAVGRFDQPVALAALNVVTSLTGSALIALAVVHGAVSAADGWAAAHVDEDYQARLWGADSEADARRSARWLEMQAAAGLLAALPQT